MARRELELPLNAAEQEVLSAREEFCQQQTGMSLHEYAQQLRDSETQAPENADVTAVSAPVDRCVRFLQVAPERVPHRGFGWALNRFVGK